MSLRGMTEEEFRALPKEKLVELLQEEQSRSELGALRMKVGMKGGISIGGLGQGFPTTLYAQSWEHLFAHAEDVLTFIREHRAGNCQCPKTCPALAKDKAS